MLFGYRTEGTQRKTIRLKTVVSVGILGPRKPSDATLGVTSAQGENLLFQSGFSASCEPGAYSQQAKTSANKKAPKPPLSLIS